MAYRFLTYLTVLGTALSGTILTAPSASAETLQETLISVYNKNPQLLAARARLREVDESYIQARAQGRPSVIASGQSSLSYITGNVSPAAVPSAGSPTEIGRISQTFTPSAAQIEVIQPLYQGGRIKALKSQAKAGILAQRESLRAAENRLFLAAASTYLDVQLAEETARVRRENVRVLTRQSVAAQERFDVGQGTRTDIAQSDARLANAESGLAQADAQLQSVRASYRRLVGRMPLNLETVPTFAMPKTLEQALKNGRENNPELIASYFNEQAGKAAIDVAKAAGRPVLSLNGIAGAQRGQLFGLEDAETAEIRAQISVPIFSGGLNKSRVRQAKQAKIRLGFETRDREWAVDEQITQIWAQKGAAEQSLIAGRKQVEAAELAFEGVTLEQEVGARSQLDVLDAEREVLNARLAMINSQKAVNAVKFQLLAAIGVFDSESIRLRYDNLYTPDANFEAIQNDGFKKLTDKVSDTIEKISPDLSENDTETP